MNKVIQYATEECKLTNTSDYYLIVGNYSRVISHHESQSEAAKAMNRIGEAGPDGLANTAWFRVDILAPGNSISGEIRIPLLREESELSLRSILKNRK